MPIDRDTQAQINDLLQITGTRTLGEAVAHVAKSKIGHDHHRRVVEVQGPPTIMSLAAEMMRADPRLSLGDAQNRAAKALRIKGAPPPVTNIGGAQFR